VLQCFAMLGSAPQRVERLAGCHNTGALQCSVL